ncbi:MAG TPA: PEGA domain-containing protein [Vicinamibacterales bacterium]|nr:PEGA domain-containing protein [Vicinamibacterales bacterium]
MNRSALALAVSVVVAMVFLIVFLSKDGARPPAAVTTAPPPSPRVVPKKVDATPPAVTEPARKTPPKKAAEPKPVVPPEAVPTLATLTLTSDVPGASVFIDRQFVGNTPLRLESLEPGNKRVQLTATGFDSIQRTIELRPGPNNITLRIKEVSLNTRMPVVHKHGIGSCNGTLSASLDGLRYETTNKGDAFTLAYSRLETFSIDYLDKNLRVKERGGKTWNFTNKEENADALFVFHRDVEAARKKLAAGYTPAR